MYLVVFDGRALKEERAYFFRSGEYCNSIFEKFPQIKTIQKSDIEEILILSLVKDDDALSVRCSKCKNLVIEENNIKIHTSGSDCHRETGVGLGGIITEEPIKTNEDLLKILKNGNYKLIKNQK